MADVNTEVTTENQQPNTDGQQNDTPTVEELMTQLASERAEKESYKNKADKASSEAAQYKKQLRSKQTAEEQEAEAKAEAERLQAEKFESMSKELNHIKAVAAYQKGISDDNDIESLIEAVADGDHSSILAVFENEYQRRIKAEKTEWMKSRPQVNAGAGDNNAPSKEQFAKMSYQQRVAFKNQYPEIYKKYTE